MKFLFLEIKKNIKSTCFGVSVSFSGLGSTSLSSRIPNSSSRSKFSLICLILSTFFSCNRLKYNIRKQKRRNTFHISFLLSKQLPFESIKIPRENCIRALSFIRGHHHQKINCVFNFHFSNATCNEQCW